VSQAILLSWPGRHMGPPHLNYPPQPVEIEAVSYPGVPDLYSSLEPTYSIGSRGKPHTPLSNSMGLNKSGPMSLGFGPRNSPQDPIANWYTENDGSWFPKGDIPEVSHNERIQTKGYIPHRGPRYNGWTIGIHQRSGYPSDDGSVHLGIPPSASGYGIGTSLECWR
jgi:hypothetical protein